MYQFLKSYGTQLAFGITALLVVFAVVYMNSKSLSYKKAYEVAKINVLKEENTKLEKPLTTTEIATQLVQASQAESSKPVILIAFVLIGLCTASALFFPVLGLKEDKTKLIRLGVFLVGALGLWLVTYNFSNEQIPGFQGAYKVKDAKISGALIGLICIGILSAVAVIIWGEINRLLKDR
jgi:predicted tellurium resistance membrane protein TerC